MAQLNAKRQPAKIYFRIGERSYDYNMTRELTCIVCPMGCSLKVELTDGKVTAISGNTCKRGEEYAENECTNPQRTVTTTIMCEDGAPIAVKTDRPVPKEKIFEVMKLVNKKVASLPVSVGDVLLDDVFGSNIVATASRGE